MSPRTKEQNEEIRRKRVRQIMDAAAEVYLKKGVLLEIRDVALVAQIGYGTVYHYYRNKHELFIDMLEDALELSRVHLAASPRVSDHPVQRLRRMVRSLLIMWMEYPGTFILYKTLSENTPLVPEEQMRSIMDTFQHQLYAPLVKLLEDALPATQSEQAEIRCNWLLASLVGCASLYVHRYRSDMDVEAVVDAILGGFIPKEG